MFRFPRQACDSNFFLPKYCIDDTRLTNIGIANQSNFNFFFLELFRIELHQLDQLSNSKHLRRVDILVNVVILIRFESSFWMIIVIDFVLFDLLKSWEEYMIDTHLDQVLVPHCYLLRTDKITLVYQKQGLLILVYLLHIIDQIFASEEQRVSSINYLNNHIRPVNYSPQLLPYLNVFFVGCDLYLGVFLLDLSQSSSPVQIGFSLLLLKLLFG